MDNLQGMVPFDLHHISFSILKLLYVRHDHSGTRSLLPADLKVLYFSAKKCTSYIIAEDDTSVCEV
jgi:hypothetical protein